MALDVLCAGAVKGLVVALEPAFAQANAGATITARFGAVGALRDLLREGAACDALVLTDALVIALEASGEVEAGSRRAIGGVPTGVAVPAGRPRPDVAGAEGLKRTLLAASALYVPDTERSTAGAHVAATLRGLGIAEAMAPRLRMFANGATAMAALAASDDPQAIGCTQVTEIAYTPGVEVVGPLPAPFGLITVYSAGVARGPRDAALASRFVALLAGAESADLRRAGGFA